MLLLATQTTQKFVCRLDVSVQHFMSFTHNSHEGAKMAHGVKLPVLESAKALSLKNQTIFFQCWATQRVLSGLPCLPRDYTEPCLDIWFSIFSAYQPRIYFFFGSSRSCSCFLTTNLLLSHQDKAHFLWLLEFSTMKDSPSSFPNQFKTEKFHNTEQLLSELVSKLCRTHDFCLFFFSKPEGR